MSVALSANLSVSTKVLVTALAALKNEVLIGGMVDRSYEKEFGNQKIGDTVYARAPVYYQAVDGPDVTGQFQSAEDGKVPVTLDQHKTVPVQFPIHDKTLMMPNFRPNYIDPMAEELAQCIDQSVVDRYWEIPNIVGTPGTGITDTSDIGAVKVFMERRAIPLQGLLGFMEPGDAEAVAKNIENKANVEGSTAAMRRSTIGTIRNFSLYSTPVQAVHTVGNYGGTPLVNGAGQVKTYSAADDLDSAKKVSETKRQQLITDGWTNSVTGVLKKGDIITIDGVYDINFRTKKQVGTELKQFTVLQDANSGASTGPATLVISPAIIVSGPYQNVSAAPADNAAITVKSGAANSTHIQQIFFPKPALTMVMAPLEIGDGMDNLKPTRVTADGFSLSMFQSGDINTLKSLKRVDALWGIKWVRPEFAVRRTQ